MTVEQMIRKFQITLQGEQIRVMGKPSAAEIVEIKAAKPEIVAAINAAKIEAEQTKKATFEFTIFGWESHKVSIDTRKNIDEQLARIAAYYPDDTTLDQVKADYLAAINGNEEKAVKAEAKKVAEESRVQEVFATAKATGTKQMLSHKIVDCDGSAIDCSMDTLTTYAMPDGTTTTVRWHTR